MTKFTDWLFEHRFHSWMTTGPFHTDTPFCRVCGKTKGEKK